MEKKLKTMASKSDKNTRKKVSDFLKLYDATTKSEEFGRTLVNDGDRVMLNIKSITESSVYERKTDNYKAYVENNKDTVFTAVSCKTPGLYTFAEDDTWFFLGSDLIVVSRKESND